MDVVERTILDHLKRINGDALDCQETEAHTIFKCRYEPHLTFRHKPVNYNERTLIHIWVEGTVLRIELQWDAVDQYNRTHLQKKWYWIPLADPKMFDKTFNIINGHLKTNLVDA